MSEYVILAESGADLSPKEAERYGIEVIQMHVTLGERPFDDDAAGNAAAMLRKSQRLGEMPRTSACTPTEFDRVFDRIHRERPSATILYLAYSAGTTCTYESALQAAKNRPYVKAIDTKNCSCGQGMVVLDTARYLENRPDASLEDVERFVCDRRQRTRLAFVPSDLEYLRQGGRLSNAAFLAASLLKIKPVVEIVDGRLIATRKLHGSMRKAALDLLDHLVEKESVDRRCIRFVRSDGLDVAVQQEVEKRAAELGFQRLEWADASCVISSHCGPAAFGAAVVAEGRQTQDA